MALSAVVVAVDDDLRDWPLGQVLEVEMATNKSLWMLGFGGGDEVGLSASWRRT